MSPYRVDSEDSREDGIVVVKLSGRAQAETTVELELNVVSERDPSHGLNRMFQGLAGADHGRLQRPSAGEGLAP